MIKAALLVARALLGHPVECPLCHCWIERGEEAVWCKHRGALVHVLCIPAYVRNLGPEMVRVWLKRGTEALFPDGHRPSRVVRAEPSRWPL